MIFPLYACRLQGETWGGGGGGGGGFERRKLISWWWGIQPASIKGAINVYVMKLNESRGRIILVKKKKKSPPHSCPQHA